MRLPAIIFAAICLLLGVGAALFVASRTINWVEKAQVAELEQSMFAAGFDWVALEADGTLVQISGEAPDAAHKSRAVEIALMIVGNGLTDTMTVAAPIVMPVETTQPMVEIMRNGDEISLIGRLPIGEGRAALDDAIEALPGGLQIVDISEEYTEALPDDWLPALKFGTQILSQVDQAIVTVTPSQVTVEAVAGSASWQDGLLELLENMRPDDVTLKVDIAAPRQVISPFVFELDLNDPSKAKCAAQNELEAQQIQQLIAALSDIDFECQIGLGTPSHLWGQVVLDSIDSLIDLGGGSLLIEDSDVFITAPIGTETAIMDDKMQLLAEKLPDIFSLQPTLPAAAPTPAEIALISEIQFAVILADDGFVTINGTIKEGLTRDVVVRYAESKFGYNLVDANFTALDDSSEGWQKRVFAAIEALALLESGQIEMTPETITLSGIAIFEAPEAEVSKLFKAALGDDVTLDLDLVYEPRAAADENALDPRVCAARVTTILADNQISFAPSSAVIEESSKPTIEAITNILTNCRNAEFEIGGHTDSQGREEMNRSLSQSRADAVLDAMLAQNLLLGPVTAVGFGESEPIADNETEDGRAANRRIVIKMLRSSDQESQADE